MRVLVVDDERPARERLHQIIDDLDGYEFVGDAKNGEDAIAQASELAPDIVLLDIRMPGLNGIETAHHLNALDKPPAVVFTTAYDEYAIDAFDAQAIGYVLKPVRRSRLEAALTQASRLAGATLSSVANQAGIETARRHVCVRSHEKLTLIPITDISVFKADQKYVTVYHKNGESLIDDSLKSLEKEFAGEFVRIHRGALVSLDKIRTLERSADGRTRVVLRNDSPGGDDELIISRRHVSEVRRRLKGS